MCQINYATYSFSLRMNIHSKSQWFSKLSFKRSTRCISSIIIAAALYFVLAQNAIAQTDEEKNPINGDAAFAILKQICNLGPRISGSEAMQHQQRMLTEYFEKFDAKVELQTFKMQHPATYEDVQIEISLCNSTRIEKNAS